MVEKYLDVVNRLGVDHECDRQTDGRTDGQTFLTANAALSYVAWPKSSLFISTVKCR